MNNKFLIVGIMLVCMFISGFVLSRTSKPFNGLILAVHKLISLGTLVYLVITVFRANRAAPLSPTAIVAAVIAAVFCIALFATGGIISAVKIAPAFVTFIHHTAPYILAALTMYVLYVV